MKAKHLSMRLLAAAAISFLSLTGEAKAQSVYVDNADSTGVVITGSWTSSTFATGQYYGIDYLHDGDTGQGTKSVRFTPNLPGAGSYQVYGIWNGSVGGNRATNAPIDIISNAGTTTLIVNQQLNSGTWTLLGTYDFNAGTSGSVLIRTSSANGYVIADAVDFVPVEADFSVHTQVSATAPPRFGFNMQLNSSGADIVHNNWIFDGDASSYDARLSLVASENGAADGSTFIDTTQYRSTDMSDSFNSNGAFNGALVRFYRFNATTNVWSLFRTGTVATMTAVSGSYLAADHTITFTGTGAQCLAGDAIWMSKDAVYQAPYDISQWINYIPALDGTGGTRFPYYVGSWANEPYPGGGSFVRNNTNPSQYIHVADVPTGEANGKSDAPAMSLKITSTAASSGTSGIWQTMANFGTALHNGTGGEQFEPNHTYAVSVWLKGTGISGSSATFSAGFASLSTTFTGITSSWYHYTKTFSSVPGTQAYAPIVQLYWKGPGTLYVYQLEFYDTSHAPFTLDPRVVQTLQDFRPGTIRFWSCFSDTSRRYPFLSLDGCLQNESANRGDPFYGNMAYCTSDQEKLPAAMALSTQVGAIPWIICNMSWSEQEWCNFIDYLAAPAGVGYAATHRPATHPGPYLTDFSKIYLEFGNEEWGTQWTATSQNNGYMYGAYAHYMLSQALTSASSRYTYAASKLKVVLNGWDNSPTYGEGALTKCPEASAVDCCLYLGTSGTTDAAFQTDLLGVTWYNTMMDQWAADEIVSAQAGRPYEITSYEGGDGSDNPSYTGPGDHSLALGVGLLDIYLYGQQKGMTAFNFYGFGLGYGLYRSHSNFSAGFRPHPVWEAMQMRNQYCAGDIVATDNNLAPRTADGKNTSLVGVYTFHELTSGTNYAEIVVISRDLYNTTTVALHLPAAPIGSATLYTLAGDPRGNNDLSLAIATGTGTIPNFTKDYTFDMPPGSIYMFKIPTGAWPVAGPTNLAVTGTGAGYSSLTIGWSPVTGGTSYKLYRSTNPANLTGLGAGTPYATVSGTSYTDSNVSVYKCYHYKVSAMVSGTETDFSTVMKASAPPIKYECESLALGANSGATYTSNYADSLASGGYRTLYASTAVGNYLTYNVNAPVTGAYNIQLCACRYTNRAIAQVFVDGVAGNTFDLYSSYTGTAGYKTYDLGTMVLTSGAHPIKFTVTGKNANSTDFALSSFDYITLNPQ